MTKSPLKVVCALIFNNGHVLAARRDRSRSFPLMWEFPGGKVECGESAEEALHRELEEELRFKVEIIKCLDLVTFGDEGHALVLHPYLCRPAQPYAPVPVDHVELRWIEPGSADSLVWAPADLPLVKRLHEWA